jgi:pyrimidine-nucleoside phosphorylase
MRAVDIIIKKRDRHILEKDEIEFFIQGYTRGEIPDYQAAAWLMAVVLNGMNVRETTDLIMAMAHSGEMLDLGRVALIAVDKHSTGGVGDKTTLVVEPVVAACGLPVGKMSGRGLGFSGGTLDKMESIPGYRTDLTIAEFLNQLGKIGLVLTGQSADLAPADGKLYALRDVTGTVQSIPLIASSIMSKKLAAGAHAILLDVKVGVGAFMTTLEDARQLSQLMVSVAVHAGRRALALLADMNQPLGYSVGNALELREAIETLQGNGPADFHQHCIEVAAHMLQLGGLVSDPQRGRDMAQESIDSGKGLEKFKQLVQAQGGDPAVIDNPANLPRARFIQEIAAPRSGHLKSINARLVGEAAVHLGAGRTRKGDPIDHAVGIVIAHKVGDRVQAGERLFTIHANQQDLMKEAIQQTLEAHAWSDDPVDPLPLFYDVIQG